MKIDWEKGKVYVREIHKMMFRKEIDKL